MRVKELKGNSFGAKALVVLVFKGRIIPECPDILETIINTICGYEL